MNWLRLIRARVAGLFGKAQREQELDDELRFHLAMRIEEKIAAGMDPEEAASEARRQLGNINSIKDACRDVSGAGALEVLWHDVRFAGRVLLRDRNFTAVAVIALALGIGANTAIFTVMSSVLLRPLPFPDSERIVTVESADSNNLARPMRVSYPNFEDFAARNTSFERLGAYRASNFVVDDLGGTALNLRGAYVHPETFAILGVKPLLGRTFRRHENEPGNRVVVVSQQFWQEHLGGTANLSKATLQIDGGTYSVIGVMPRSFRFPIGNEPAHIWTSFATDHEPYPSGAPAYTTRRDGHILNLLARLKKGVTAAEAQADLNAIAGDLARAFPATNARFDACIVLPWLSQLTKGVKPTLMLLEAAALCVLAVACVNVANLLLARGTVRQKEIAIRAALGAGRRRILRQLLTESMLLALLGGCAGLMLALFGTRYLVSLLPPDFPRLGEIAPDPGVLAFAVLITMATSCLFGFAPAWRSARCDLAPLLNDVSKGISESRSGRRTRRALVITEMVLAFVLLAGACCLIRGVWRLQNTELGFNPRNLLMAGLSIRDKSGEEGRDYAAVFYARLISQLQNTPGVMSATAVYPPSIGRPQAVTDVEFAGRAIPKEDLPRAESHIVTLNYFGTMQIPLKEGRDFNERDELGATPVAIINETFARKHFAGEDPIGRRIKPGMSVTGTFEEREIIGVVGDVRPNSLLREPVEEVYLPHAQLPTFNLWLLVRTHGPPSALVPELAAIVHELEDNVPVFEVTTVEDRLTLSIAQPRLSSTLLSLFAFVAVSLTAIGVYGVMAYSAAQRRHEIGIRLALGAQKLAVVRLVLKDGLRLIGYAIVGGGLCTFASLPLLQRFGDGVASTDAPVILLVALLLSSVALIACWLPARRAAGVDPLVALGQR